MDSYLVQRQVGDGLPLASGVERRSGMALPPATVAWRLRHMDSAVFATDPESHLVRFASAILGDAGVGQLRKRMLLYRLQSSLSSSHFYTLDKFYGSLFGVQRRRSETLSVERNGERQPFDPGLEVAGAEEWQTVLDSDASYRARIIQFARALSHGPTPLGIELVSEAILGVDVDVFEDYAGALEPESLLTWGEVSAFFGTYSSIELFQLTYGMVTIFGGGPVNVPRNTFTIVPKAIITSEERRDLYRVLRRVMPVSTSFTITQPETLAATYIPVQPRLLDASSHYWQVNNYIVPSSESARAYKTTERTEVKRPPFSAYQGEAWSYIAEVSSIVSYAQSSASERAEEPNYETLTFLSGESRSYPPQFALFSPQEVAQGRLSSDGIAVAHPYSGSQLLSQRNDDETVPNYTGFQDTTSPMFLEGVEAKRLGESTPTARWWSRSTSRQYWSTPQRPQDSPVVEAIEAEFDGDSDKLSNYITIEVPRFPHITTVQVWSSASGWKTVLSQTVQDSFPERIPYETGNFHPQHDVDGHWQKVSKRFAPLEVRRIRVMQTRTQGGKAPVDARGNPVPYSLGARRLDLGYRVNRRSDLPQTVRPGEIFATSTDAYGNRLEYEVIEYGPSNLLASPSLSWLSEPQPTSHAVVRLYADLRDGAGEGQLFDRVWIDPLYPGSSLNLYYSNDDTEAKSDRWESSSRPISASAISNVGTIAVDNASIRLSTGAPSGLSIDNGNLQWDTSQDWWLGLNFLMPNYTVGESDDDETVDPVDPAEPRLLWFSSNADVGTLDDFYTPEDSDDAVLRLGDNYCMALVYEPGELRFVYATETSVRNLRLPLDFQPETSVAVTLGWDAASSRFTLGGKTLYGEATSVDSDSSEEFTEGGLPIRLGSVRFMSLGHPVIPSEGNPVVPAFPARIVVNSFVLKSGQSPSISAEPGRFLSQPNNYVIKSRFAEPGYDSTDNTVIRYSPTFYGNDNPWGMVGGALAKWDSVEWTPIPRDFTAQRGFLYCPPTKARFVCLEFTELIPEPYEVFANQTQEVEVFAGQPEPFTAPSSSDVYASVPGLTSAIGDYKVTDESYSQSAVSLYVSDPELRSELAKTNTLWRFQSIYGSGPQRQRFTQTGKHQYATKVVERSERIAYFAGLKDLKFYRLSHSYQDDTAVYLDTLDDTSLLSSFTFRHRDGMLDSKNSATAEAVSKTFTSRTQVYALQFASQQSDAVQVLPNDDFSSPAFLKNDWDGLVIEEVTLNEEDPSALSLTDPLISSVVVASLDGTVTYREYDDFVVEYDGTPTITRVDGGAIDDGETVRVAYQRETYGWQKVGTASLMYQPEQKRVLIERDVVPESLFRGPDGSLVQRIVNPVFSSRANASVGESDFAGLISPTVAVTRRGRMEAVVRVTLRTDLTSPLYLAVLNAEVTGFLGEAILESGLAGETHEISLPLTSSESLAVLPNYGYSTIVDHPIYPMSPVYDDIDPEDQPDSDWPLVDISGGEPTFAGVRVGLYQLGATTDSWYINKMSLYDESLMWEFTADDATDENAVWYPIGGSVRNNPAGAFRFRQPTNRWAFRVTAMRSNLKVNAWQVRPLYVEKAPVQFLPQFRGSNDSLYDQFPPIEQDPMYDNWTRVAPRSWFQSGADFTKASILGVALPFEGNRPWRRSASVSVSEPDAEATQDLSATRVVTNSAPVPTVTVTAEIVPPEEPEE